MTSSNSVSVTPEPYFKTKPTDVMMAAVPVIRTQQYISRDTSRVICRLHLPGGNPARADKIIQRIMNLESEKVEELLEQVVDDFYDRHRDIERIFERHFKNVHDLLSPGKEHNIPRSRKLLIGACFTMEYAIESAALFNPSIVLHPNQSGLPEDSLRFIMSLRATGEGHISSIVFRSGMINSEGELIFDEVSPYATTPDMQLNPEYEREVIRKKLRWLGECNEIATHILDQLPEMFTYQQLKEKMARLIEDPVFPPERQFECFHQMHWIVNSNYRLDFPPDHQISERVIFPVSEIESGGIEDARFVQFHAEHGEQIYYATYTAYNGRNIIPQLIETRDFEHFKVSTLNGHAVQNKGMALFPRKINGKYAMLSRQDGENNYIMFSDDIHFWDDSQIVQEPAEPWEFIQVGNCGSPLETHEGWLVLTHGVGPMRVYSIGAILLDLKDPSKMIARLTEPLIRPYEMEREGYVPNVVYTCGAIFHLDELIIPFSMSDIQAGVVRVKVDDLFSAMKPV